MDQNRPCRRAARHGSPLVLGVGKDEYFIASDASPIVEHTRNVIYLDEGEITTINEKGHSIRSMKDDVIVNKETTEIEFSIEEIEKGEFPHFMLKEIYEQVFTIKDTMRGRINPIDGTAHLGGIEHQMSRIQTTHVGSLPRSSFSGTQSSGSSSSAAPR